MSFKKLNLKGLILEGFFINFQLFFLFDSGKFIPELRDIPISQIHQPKDDLFLSTDYPAPILDLKESRIRAIQAFKDAREMSSI